VFAPTAPLVVGIDDTVEASEENGLAPGSIAIRTFSDERLLKPVSTMAKFDVAGQDSRAQRT